MPAESELRDDWSILVLLTDADDQRPWSVDELSRQFGDRLAVTDALARLQAAGLINRVDTLVFASRTALRYSQLTP